MGLRSPGESGGAGGPGGTPAPGERGPPVVVISVLIVKASLHRDVVLVRAEKAVGAGSDAGHRRAGGIVGGIDVIDRYLFQDLDAFHVLEDGVDLAEEELASKGPTF